MKHHSGEIILAIVKALLGEVIPHLRCVVFEITKEKIIVFFYHDGPITPLIEEHYSCIHSEASIDFIFEGKLFPSSFKVIRLDYPQHLPTNNYYWAYRRREPFENLT